MGYDRRWLDEPHVGDHVGRSRAGDRRAALDRLGAGTRRPEQRACSASLVRSLEGEVSLRTAAYASIGLARLDADRLDERARARAATRSSTSLLDAYERRRGRRLALVRGPADATTTPPAARADRRRCPPRARRRRRGGPRRRCAGSATSAASRTASCGWSGTTAGTRTEPAPGGGDEQPLDACAFVEAELAAFAVTGDADHAVRARDGVRLVPRPQPARPSALRLRHRRLQRRPRQRRPERQRGRRVDARVPSRADGDRGRGAAGAVPTPAVPTMVSA